MKFLLHFDRQKRKHLASLRTNMVPVGDCTLALLQGGIDEVHSVSRRIKRTRLTMTGVTRRTADVAGFNLHCRADRCQSVCILVRWLQASAG